MQGSYLFMCIVAYCRLATQNRDHTEFPIAMFLASVLTSSIIHPPPPPKTFKMEDIRGRGEVWRTGLEFYRGYCRREKQNAVDHCGNDGNFLPYCAIFILFTVHYYFDT